MSQTVFEQVYQLTRQIPSGRVATYGQIARLMGNPRLSRVVGYAMHTAPEDVPCHRVVSRFGGLSDAFRPLGKETQRMLLAAEGVGFSADGCVDLARFQWAGPGQENGPPGASF
ncbi:MAG: MGMT family protein [Oscillospiraceae bacterium]|nr:MGMT family protein [Oscillospiraceae bacterium]